MPKPKTPQKSNVSQTAVSNSANIKIKTTVGPATKVRERQARAFQKQASRTMSASAGWTGSGSGLDLNYMAPEYYHPSLQSNQLLLPKSRREKNLWARHFYENDPLVSAAIDFHTELPLSSIRLTLPDAQNHERAQEVLEFYENMVEHIKLFQTLLDISHEYWLLGNVYPFAEWDQENNVWSKILVLDPDDVLVEKFPFTDKYKIELVVPEEAKQAVTSPGLGGKWNALSDVPKDVLAYIQKGVNIPLGNDPFLGSHVAHIAHKRSPYRTLGSSVIERVFKLLVYKDKLRNAQDAIAERNMTPKNIVVADKVSGPTLDDLRGQIEASFTDPDFVLITNYPVSWEMKGANERLLTIQSEFDFIENEILAGLGVTKGLITGEGSYGGEYVTLEVINQRYMLFRETLTNWVENNLFKPVAYHNGFWEKDAKGFRRLIYPKMVFNRLNLRDNTEAFQNLFNLYSKGSLDISTLLELYHLDPIEIRARLEKDFFTVNDPTFNDFMRTAYQELARTIAAGTDLPEKVAAYLNLRMKAPPAGGAGGQ